MMAASMNHSMPSPSASNARSKAPLEEKFVHLYREIFSGCSPINSKKGFGIQGHSAVTRFWDELLLLKVNEGFLVQCISSLTETELRKEMKMILNELFGTCSLYLEDENFIRVAHSLETLMVLFQEISKKRFDEQGFTIITLIAGSVENADVYFMRLLNRVANLLQRDDVPIPVKSLSLRLYFTILTTTDNINTNVLASYFFQNSIFNSILAALSVKLYDDRRSLELDATLVLIMLLLWRESRNIYVDILSSTSMPVLPFLQAAQSLMASREKGHDTPPSSGALQIWSLTDSLSGLMGSLFGFGLGPATESDDHSINTMSLTRKEEVWLHTTCGVALAYFLIYHSPLVKSTQLWPSSKDLSFEGPGSIPQSISSSWMQVLKSVISLCGNSVSQLSKGDVADLLQEKCCLNLLRCLVESKEAMEFLALCDAEDFTLRRAPGGGISGLPHTLTFRSILSVIIDHVATLLNVSLANISVDADLFNRAALLIPVVFNRLKLQGWQLSSQSIDWLSLWNGLMGVCKWCGSKINFQRPAVSDLAELVLGILESCLGSSQEICAEPEVSECLHAVVVSQASTVDALLEAAALVPSSGIRVSTHMVNINAVRAHYEIQVAALGVRGCPTYEQALQAVQKKGMLNLKLKPKHAGPTRAYAEGTAEIGVLMNATRSLVALRRKQTLLRPLRLQVSTMGQQQGG